MEETLDWKLNDVINAFEMKSTEVYPDHPDLLASVKKFVLFVGYARSGHSIIRAPTLMSS